MLFLNAEHQGCTPISYAIVLMPKKNEVLIMDIRHIMHSYKIFVVGKYIHAHGCQAPHIHLKRNSNLT
jgi:uncharacterized protein (UPF0305 family)